MSVTEAIKKLPWAQNHPHLCRNQESEKLDQNDTVYIASDTLVINGEDTGMPGGGIFIQYDLKLLLSAPGYTKSHWKLPKWFYPKNEGHVCLTSHKNPERWHKKKNHVILDTVPRGQEFIFDCEQYPEAIDWLKQIMVMRKAP